MPLEKFSRNHQIIIYVAILVVAVVFLFYFFRQASVKQGDLSDIVVMISRPVAAASSATIKINLNLLGVEKFLNLRSEVLPVSNFQVGKRNPFAPQ